MKDKKTKITKLSWAQIEELVRKLAGRIQTSGFRPDWAVGITNGGLIPLALTVNELGIDKIVTVSVNSYEKDSRKKPRITYWPKINLKGRKVLLVDDIADTGETLKRVSELFLKQYKVGELKTATIAINKIRCDFRPDFYELAVVNWLVFPWERKEFPEYF